MDSWRHGLLNRWMGERMDGRTDRYMYCGVSGLKDDYKMMDGWMDIWPIA